MPCNSNWTQRVVIARTPTCPCRMRAGIRFRASIARLLEVQPLSQPPSQKLFIRNQKTTTEGSKTGKRSRRAPLTKKDLREELAEKWLLSLSSGESNATGELKAEVAATLELCAAVDGGEEEGNSSGDATNYNGNGNGWVLGIDPDVCGAVAVLKPTEDSDSPVAQVYDSPTTQVFVGKRNRRRPDTRSIVSLIREMGIPKGSLAYIERSLPFPTDGKQGWYGCGFGYGLWIGILVSFGISVIPISSVVWKKHFDLIGRTSCKDDSRVIACELFPHLSPQLKRKKDHGRAEALLIARYGRDSMNVST